MRHESTSPNNDCPDKGSRNIINLTIPDGVQELPDDAFRGYSIFSNAELPATLKRLGEKGVLDIETRIFTPNSEMGSGYRRIAEDGKWGVLDLNEQRVVPCVWDDVIWWYYDVFGARSGETWQAVNVKAIK